MMTMQSREELIQRVDAYAESNDVDELHPDVVSLFATYGAKREAGDDRAAYAFARAIARRVDLGEAERGEMTVPDMKAEIARRNEGRDEADQIKPASQRKADLAAALAADDAGA